MGHTGVRGVKGVLYKKLLGQPVGLADLAELQPEIHR